MARGFTRTTSYLRISTKTCPSNRAPNPQTRHIDLHETLGGSAPRTANTQSYITLMRLSKIFSARSALTLSATDFQTSYCSLSSHNMLVTTNSRHEACVNLGYPNRVIFMATNNVPSPSAVWTNFSPTMFKHTSSRTYRRIAERYNAEFLYKPISPP